MIGSVSPPARPRSALIGNYGRHVFDGARTAIISHALSDELTPLHDLAAPALYQLPRELKRDLRDDFWRKLEGEPFAPAPPQDDWREKRRLMTELAGVVNDLIGQHIGIAFDYHEIESRARKYAEICARFTSLRHYPEYRRRYANANGDHKIWQSKIRYIEEFCAAKGVAPPAITPTGNARGRVMRACTTKFWRRRLLVNYGRGTEHASRKAGLVQRKRSIYVSGLAFCAHRQKVAATEKWLKECRAISDAGDQLSLWEVHEASQANPANRRAELMTRIRGFEEIAKELGHIGEFVTLTTPSEYHATNADGTPNRNYAGHTVRDGQEWLRKMWARSRAKLKRKGITIYGIRIAEPHHDGTPHWHMVLFTMANRRQEVRRVLAGYWLSEGGRDAGAKDHRIKFKAIDEAKGSAAGYLAKYVAKNIDGFEVGNDLEIDDGAKIPPAGDRRKRDAALSARRVVAWASLHGIRQFQQIGGPPVTLYRECRRMRKPVEHASIEAARLAADAGEWADFIRKTGGIAAGRAGALAVWSEISGELNQYEELRPPQIVGVSGAEGRVKTHEKIWRIERCANGAGHGQDLLPDASSDSISSSLSSRFLAGAETRTGRSEKASGSGVYLGPVPITVRSDFSAGSTDFWTDPNEKSTYGPN